MRGEEGGPTFFDCVSKVDGSMLGKSFRATGSRNSINGTMMKTRKGRSLKTSAHVLRNWGKISGRIIMVFLVIISVCFCANALNLNVVNHVIVTPCQ